MTRTCSTFLFFLHFPQINFPCCIQAKKQRRYEHESDQREKLDDVVEHPMNLHQEKKQINENGFNRKKNHQIGIVLHGEPTPPPLCGGIASFKPLLLYGRVFWRGNK